MIQIKGNHPYADEFPMASEEELAELTSSIATTGLIHPIVLTPDGLILDGRNRMEACKRAGVKPDFVTREGSDDDYKEFVIGVNTTGRRESMTLQIAAASAALILGHERRINGQWKRGALSRNPDLKTGAMKEPIAQAGFVLDILGPAHLRAVRDGDQTLNAVYEQARAEKQRQEEEVQAESRRAQQREEEEEYARNFFATDNAAGVWLSKRTGQHKTLWSAFKQYEAEHEETRRAEERKRREEEDKRREFEETIQRQARHLFAFVSNFPTGLEMRDHQYRKEILAACTDDTRDKFLNIENTYLKES